MAEPVICAFSKQVKEDGQIIPAHFDYTYKDGELLSAKELTAFETWKWGKWQPGTVTYEVIAFTDDITRAKIKSAVGTFFQMVEPFCNGINFTSIGDYHNKPDIPVEWRMRDDYLRAPGRGNVIAYTTMPVGDPRKMPYDQRAIIFDDAEAWTPYGKPFKDASKNPKWPDTLYRSESIVYTGGHELLHKLGLHHGKTGMMQPYVSENPAPIIDKEAESRLYQIYGKPNILTQKINRFRIWRMAKAGIK